MFVDELKIKVKSGDGGDGVVRWLHQKHKEFGGPSGGNGGKGGDVYVVGVKDIGILSKYSHDPEFFAENGGEGGNNSKEGKNGEDLKIKLPVGSILKKIGTTPTPKNKNGVGVPTLSETSVGNEEIEILEEGKEILILRGGKRGLGNEHFKSSKNVNPFESTKGKKGESAEYFVELRLFADAGFIGLPSAGKSSLLNELTNAKSKVGEYHFTTLEPHLGSFYGFILADIPGLIEGASEGKGLGHKFLRHISRTKILFHLVSMESEDPMQDYKTIRAELEKFDPELANKKEVVILSKIDLVEKKEVEKLKKEFEKMGKEVLVVTILDDSSVKDLSEAISNLLSQ